MYLEHTTRSGGWVLIARHVNQVHTRLLWGETLHARNFVRLEVIQKMPYAAQTAPLENTATLTDPQRVKNVNLEHLAQVGQALDVNYVRRRRFRVTQVPQAALPALMHAIASIMEHPNVLFVRRDIIIVFRQQNNAFYVTLDHIQSITPHQIAPLACLENTTHDRARVAALTVHWGRMWVCGKKPPAIYVHMDPFRLIMVVARV